jgi:hypothetical protein
MKSQHAGVGRRRQLALDFLFTIVQHDENRTVYQRHTLRHFGRHSPELTAGNLMVSDSVPFGSRDSGRQYGKG